MTDCMIAAIDLGYGETKIAWHTPDGTVHRSFRSIVELAPTQDLELHGSSRRRTVRVKVDDVEYEVGTDAHLVASRPDEEKDHDDAVGTPEWMAKAKAALATIGAERIALLVIGLPVERFFKKGAKDFASARLTGVHEHCGGRTVRVERVLVLPQPMGGLIDFMEHGPSGIRNGLSRQGVLVVDPGFYTTDYLLTLGGQGAPKRSGSTEYGIKKVILMAKNAMVREHGGAPSIYSIADASKNGEGTVFAAGVEVRLEPYLQQALKVVGDRVLDGIRATVKTFEDIDVILMVGGGAPLFRPLISSGLPVKSVQVAPFPGFANVRGYLEYGRAKA